jgi:hypothetical protein
MSYQKYKLKLELNMNDRKKSENENLLLINLNNLNSLNSLNSVNGHFHSKSSDRDKITSDILEKIKLKNSNFKNSFQILKNLKLVPDLQTLLRNEYFLEHAIKFIQNIIFRIPKYISKEFNFI